jgi:hypothetical protein
MAQWPATAGRKRDMLKHDSGYFERMSSYKERQSLVYEEMCLVHDSH